MILPFLLSGKKRAVSYLLREQFTTAASAPLTSPRACEPGPGTFTVTDTANNFSITADGLVFTASVNTYDPMLQAPANLGNAVGTCMFLKMKMPGATNRWVAYYDKETNVISLRASSGQLACNGGEQMGTPPGDGALHRYYIINQNPGQFFIMDNKILFVGRVSVTAPCRPVIMSYTNSSSSATVRELAVAVLPAPWNDLYSHATDRIAAPATGATINHAADAWVEIAWTCATNETVDLMVRRVDDNNCWIVRCSQSGSTIKIIEKVAGEETERASAAQTFLNTGLYRIHALVEGANIKVFVGLGINSASYKTTWATMTTHLDALTAKASGFAAAAEFVSWPRVLSAADLAALQKLG